MSHFTKLAKANITDPEAFKEACKELGLTQIAEKIPGKARPKIRGYMGRSQGVDIAVTLPGSYDVGLTKDAEQDDRWNMVADWGMMRIDQPLSDQIGGARGSDLGDALSRLTVKHTLMEQYRKQGFTARVQVDEQHNIHLSLTR